MGGGADRHAVPGAPGPGGRRVAALAQAGAVLQAAAKKVKRQYDLLSMKKLEESLPARRFLRIHKSYLVNLERISQVSKGHVLMEDGASLPVGDLYREPLLRFVSSKTLGK